MQNVLIVLFDVNSNQELENAKFYVESLDDTSKPNLLIWNGLDQLQEFQRKRLMSVFGKDVYGLTENKNGFFTVLKELGSCDLHFLDTPELHIESGVLSKIFETPGLKITESFFRKEFDLAAKRHIPSKFFLKNHECLWKILPISKDFEIYGLDKGKKRSSEKEKNRRLGMVVTFYKTNYNNYESLKEMLKNLSFKDWFIVLATHSVVPEEIQEYCDLVIYESENLADQRKYSHGVAETSLIRKSLVALKDIGIEWTYKMCYDVEISDLSKFDEWVKDFEYDFVSCKWGEKIVSTNSFFCNIDFALNNFSFFDSIEKMFEKSFFIEDVWEMDIVNKKLTDRIFTYQTKDEMFGKNKMDTNFFNYDHIKFSFDEGNKIFYIENTGDKPLVGRLSIVDYYSDLAIYIDDCFIGTGTIWVAPNPIFQDNDMPKNGYYMEVCDDSWNVLVKRNVGIKNFGMKHTFHRIHNGIRRDWLSFSKEFKYGEFVAFDKMKMYDKFGLSERNIKTFIDGGAHAGIFTLALLGLGANKGYLIEPASHLFNILKKNMETKWLKVIDKALYKEDGKVEFNISEDWETTHAIKQDWSRVKEKYIVDAITIDSFFADFVDEDEIDLFKIDIEGGEYDAFEGMSDETMKRCRNFLIEYHANNDMKVLSLVERLVKNGYNIIFEKFYPNDTDNYLSNDMGILFAHR
jgi:FkbM family methyltransferase